MTAGWKKEVYVIGIVLLPFIYLAYLWEQLPANVPMHWNAMGEIDRYGSKWELWIIPMVLPLLTYIIFLIVPMIDPKNKIQQMGGKYFQLKFIFTLLMSVLALYIIQSVKQESLFNEQYLFILLSTLFIVMGNYFKTIRPNYFIGIRTPWTLENETVWKETHRIGGWIILTGGFLVLIACFIFEKQVTFTIFWTITALIVVIPIVFSYIRYKQLKK